MKLSTIPVLLSLTCLGLAADDVKPLEAPKKPWSDKCSLSFVSVGGNAKSQSFGFANEYKCNWTNSTLAFNTGGVRVDTTTFHRSAFGPNLSQVSVLESETTTRTAESYLANLRYDHKISDGKFWFASTGWDRNEPSGIENRYMSNAGLGYWWAKSDRTKFRTDLGLGYTQITPVLVTPGFQESFSTWSFGTDFEHKFMTTSKFNSKFQFTNSWKNGQDYLLAWQNALTVTMNAHLALQVGYNLAHKNNPAFIGVDVVQTPVATPPAVIGQVPVQLKPTDVMFTTSLVFTL